MFKPLVINFGDLGDYSKSKVKVKPIRKIPDPYLNLFHKNRQFEMMKNSIKIY